MSYFSAASTSRKEDQLSSRYLNKDEQLNYRYPVRNENYPPKHDRQQFTATIRNVSTHKQSVLQEQQIADLQRKIDLILMHNQKLQSEKQRYRLLYEQSRLQQSQRAYQSNTARFISQENEMIIQKLRKELQLSSKNYEQKLNQAYESRKILKEQIQTLSKITQDLNQQNKQLKISIKQQSLKVQSLSFQLKQQFIRQQAQLQNKLRDQFLIRQIQLKNQRKQIMDQYEIQIQNLKKAFNKQKEQIFNKQDQQLNELKQLFEDDKKNLIAKMRNQFEIQLENVKNQHKQEIKKQQDKAIHYIQQNIKNAEQHDQIIKQDYQIEINRLKDSLQARKNVINTLLDQKDSHNQTNPRQNSWLPQFIALKQQLSQLTNQYLQESQLLKLKLTQKFQIDVSSLKKIYQDKIQLMALHTQRVQQQNTKLRNLYQRSLQNQIDTKKDFQIQKGKLKNIIRKLGIQLHGIQQEFKINIQGIRDQNSAFSMTMMKSMIQVKQKANFYSQQNRKLRKAYEQHEAQVNEQKKIAQQKISYYETSYQKLKEKYKNDINQIKGQLQIIQQESQQRQNQLRQSLNRQHEMIHSVVQGLRKDNDQLTQQNQQLKRKCHGLQISFKDKNLQISDLKSIVSQLQADIQRLKLDLSMAGVNDQNHTDTINQWKNHYETIISQLQEQKRILNQKLSQKDQQLAQIVKKYKILEQQLAKVVKTLKKRSHLQKKVIQIGTDNNLVKNISQLFGKNIQESSQEK